MEVFSLTELVTIVFNNLDIQQSLTFRLISKLCWSICGEKFIDTYIHIYPTPKSMTVCNRATCLKLMIDRGVYDRDLCDYFYFNNHLFDPIVSYYRLIIAIRSQDINFVREEFKCFGYSFLSNPDIANECVKCDNEEILALVVEIVPHESKKELLKAAIKGRNTYLVSGLSK